MINDIKFYNETIHGTDFSNGVGVSYLHGNIGDKCKAVITIEKELSATCDSNYTFSVEGSSDRITRIVGSFFEDGFFPGQTISFAIIAPTPHTFTATLDYVDDLYMDYTLVSGVDTTEVVTDGKIIVTNNVTGVAYRYGLIENDEPINFLSKVNGVTQEWIKTGITVASTNSLLFKGSIGANKDGSVSVTYTSNTSGVHLFTITHYFTITPIFLSEYDDEITLETIPDLFIGAKSLRYVFQSDFRFDNNNPNNILTETFSRYKGSVGWIGEGLNGNLSAYEIGTVTYTDNNRGLSIDGVNTVTKTKITIPIIGTIPSSPYFTATILTARKSSYYEVEKQEFKDVFLYDTLQTSGGINGSGIIKRLTYSANTVTMYVEYTQPQIDSIDYNNDKFLILLSIANSTLAVSATDKVTLLVGYDNYVNSGDTEGLLSWNSSLVFAHNDTTNGKTSYRGWPQDGVRVEWEAELIADSTLESLRYDIVARKTTEELFVISSYNVDLGNPTINSSGVQLFNVAKTRGFNLADDDPFNELSVLTTATSPITITSIGSVKIPWQSWIKNTNVDTIFADTAEPNDNLNQLASNYEANGYSLYLSIVAGVSYNNLPITEYAKLIELDAYDQGYDPNAPDVWTAVIQIKDINDNETAIIDTTTDNKIVATFTPSGGSTSIFDDIVGVVRIERKEQPGEIIYEFSSLRDTFTENVLKPLTGQTLLKLTDSGTTVVLECLVDGELLTSGDYVVSARLFHGYSGSLSPVFSIDTVAYAGVGVFNLPITAEKDIADTAAIPDGNQVIIRVQNGGTVIENISGLISEDISNFTTDIAVANSIVSFCAGTVTNNATLTFDKLAWAVQNNLTNADAVTLTIYSKGRYLGFTGADDSATVPIVSSDGKGNPYDIDYLSADTLFFADYDNGIRKYDTDGFTELSGILTSVTRVSVDRTNSVIYATKASSAFLYYVDSTNRADLGFSGTPDTITLSWNPSFIHVNNLHSNSGVPDKYIGKDAYDSTLFLKYWSGSAYVDLDLSTKVSGIHASLKVNSVIEDANGDIWLGCHRSGHGIYIIKLSISGSYYTLGSWTATSIYEENIATANPNDIFKINIVGYDTTMNAISGTNPIIFISNPIFDQYNRLIYSGSWTLDSPALYCGTTGTVSNTFGSGNIEVGLVRGMVYYKAVGISRMYGCISTDYCIYKSNNFAGAGTQVSEKIFGGTSGYEERIAF